MIPPNLPHIVNGTILLDGKHLVKEDFQNVTTTDIRPSDVGWTFEGNADTSVAWLPG